MIYLLFNTVYIQSCNSWPTLYCNGMLLTIKMVCILVFNLFNKIVTLSAKSSLILGQNKAIFAEGVTNNALLLSACYFILCPVNNK